MLLTLFAGCEMHGTLYRSAWEGYNLRDKMIDAGIVGCAEVFLQLHSLDLAMENLDEQSDELSGDEYDDKSQAIYDQMVQIERRLPAESWDEINVLLWKFAQRYELEKLNP